MAARRPFKRSLTNLSELKAPPVTEPRNPARALDAIRIAPDFDAPDAQIETLFAGDIPDDEAGR